MQLRLSVSGRPVNKPHTLANAPLLQISDRVASEKRARLTFWAPAQCGSASQSEVMTVVVGFSPQRDGKTGPRRVATPESGLGRAINFQASLRGCSKTEMPDKRNCFNALDKGTFRLAQYLPIAASETEPNVLLHNRLLQIAHRRVNSHSHGRSRRAPGPKRSVSAKILKPPRSSVRREVFIHINPTLNPFLQARTYAL